MKFEIKNWISGKLMFTLEGENWKVAFTVAFKAGNKFEYADLSGKDFSGIEVEGGAFIGTRFIDTRFSDTSFSGTRFIGTSFIDTRFIDTRFIDTRFIDTRFSGTSFSGTSFSDTSFSGTRFSGTSFIDTSFKKSTFNGKKITEFERPIFTIHPLGSDQHTLVAISTEVGIHLQTGCFNGSVDEFNTALKKKHGDNEHAREYTAALALVELHFKLWAKKK